MHLDMRQLNRLRCISGPRSQCLVDYWWRQDRCIQVGFVAWIFLFACVFFFSRERNLRFRNRKRRNGVISRRDGQFSPVANSRVSLMHSRALRHLAEDKTHSPTSGFSRVKLRI